MAAEDGSSGFPWAVKTGDLNGVQEAVAAGADVNMVSQDTNRRTPVHWAADFGQLEVMKYLVSQGAKFDTPDNFGITPLLAAVYEKHDAVVEYLCSLGANLSARGPDGMTPLEAAETSSLKTILKNAGAADAPAAAAAPPPTAAAAPPSTASRAPPKPPAKPSKGFFGFGKK